MSELNQNRLDYKETRVGWIPTEWDVRPFGEIAKRRKQRFNPNSNGQGYKCIELEHIDQVTGTVLGHVDSKDQASSKNKFFPGDVLFGKLRPYLRKHTHVNFEGVCSSEIWVLQNQKVSLSEYVYLLVQSNKFIAFSNKTSGTKMPRAEWDLVSGVLFPLPPLPEQQKIAEILSTWDKVIELVGKQIKAKQRMKKGLMQQLLAGNMRFPGFQESWKEEELGEFLKIKLRKVEKPNQSYLRLGVRSHGKGTFTTIVDDPSKVDMTHLYQVREGDLIVSITFAWEGAIAMVEADGELAHVSHRFPTYTFDTKKIIPEFFRYLMHTPRFFYDLGVVSPGGAGRNRVISKKNFLKIKVRVPSLEEQRKIGGVLRSLDSEINFLEMKLEQLKKQKQGLMQKLLTGEVRVKV